MMENFLPFCLFILIALIYFREYIFGGMVPFGRDDAITYQPQRWFFINGIKSGYIPLWCPYIGFGHPMAAEGQCTLLHPFTFLFFIFSFYKAYTLSVVLCYPLFAFFLYRFCRTWGLKREGSILCAILVTYCGAYLLWQGHYAIISTLLWLPLVLLYLVKTCRRWNGTHAGLAAVFYTLMIFSGGIQFTYVGTIFTILFLLTIGDGGRNFGLRAVICAALPVFIIGGMIAAIQLLPLYELMRMSERTGQYFDPAAGKLHWHQISVLGTSLFYGSKEAIMAEGTKFGYLGFLATLFAILGVASSRKKWPVILLGAICIIISLGGVTTLGLFREAQRMLFFLAFTLGLYAGFGFDAALRKENSGGQIKRTVYIASIILVLLTLISRSHFNVFTAAQYIRLLAPALIAIALLFSIILFFRKLPKIAMAIVLIFGLAGSVFTLNWGGKETAVPRRSLESMPPVAEALQGIADEGRVWISLEDDREKLPLNFHDYVFGPRSLLYGLTTTAHETPLFVRGVMTFQHWNYNYIKNDIERKDNKKFAHAVILTGLKYIAVPPEVADKTDFIEVERRMDTNPPYAIEEIPCYRGMAFFIFPRTVEYVSGENDTLNTDRFEFDERSGMKSLVLNGPERNIGTTPAATSLKLVGHNKNPNRWKIEYSAPAGSFLFISQVKYPGWKAYINGKPTHLYSAYGLFSGVVVDDEEGVVELKYQPASWKYGGIISIAGICLLLIIIAIHFSRAKQGESRGFQ